jgi:Fis family transcriptional regulator, factor for inversion stimulation protein
MSAVTAARCCNRQSVAWSHNDASALQQVGSRSAVSRTRENGAVSKTAIAANSEPLSDLTEQALQTYFANLNGHSPASLYDLVMKEVERPLFRAVMDYTGGNQSHAASILGINRGTLRKKLRTYELLI